MKGLTGVERIEAERRRQIEAEGWTAGHDTEHEDGALGAAAACYAQYAERQAYYGADSTMPWVTRVPLDWPWLPTWWKPSPDPIRNLEKAGALIAAEIDRLLASGEEA